MLYLKGYFGFEADNLIDGIVDFFEKLQPFDDGDFKTPSSFPYFSNCSCYGRHSGYWGIVKLLKGLSFIPENRRSDKARSLLNRCIDFIPACLCKHLFANVIFQKKLYIFCYAENYNSLIVFFMPIRYDKIKLLLIEDNEFIGESIYSQMKSQGFTIHWCQSGEEGLEYINQETVDIVILDIQLPGISGYDVAAQLNEKCIPYLFSSSRTLDIDVVTGLKIGAEDYLRKPFSMDELKLRLERIVNYRCQMHSLSMPNQEDVIEFDALKTSIYFVIEDRHVDLTPLEYDLLQYLYARKSCFICSDDIFKDVWKKSEYCNSENMVRVNIRRLREKIEPDPAHPVYILSRWGSGYCFTIPE